MVSAIARLDGHAASPVVVKFLAYRACWHIASFVAGTCRHMVIVSRWRGVVRQVVPSRAALVECVVPGKAQREGLRSARSPFLRGRQAEATAVAAVPVSVARARALDVLAGEARTCSVFAGVAHPLPQRRSAAYLLSDATRLCGQQLWQWEAIAARMRCAPLAAFVAAADQPIFNVGASALKGVEDKTDADKNGIGPHDLRSTQCFSVAERLVLPDPVSLRQSTRRREPFCQRLDERRPIKHLGLRPRMAH